jgi:hypothetical protein
MASAEKRVRNGRARWYARYRTPDGQQRTRTFARKVDADHFLVEIEASKQRGSFVDPRRASPMVGDWADDWLAAQADLSHTTRTATRGSSQGTYGRAGDACGWVTLHMRRCSVGLPDSNWHRPA